MPRALVLALLLALPGNVVFASGCEMTTSNPEVDTQAHGDGVPRFYVDNDFNPDFFSTWIYEESNGIDGLQRQDELSDDTCGGTAGPGDTIIF